MIKNLDIYSRLYRDHVDDLYSYGTGMGFGDSICMDAIHDVFCKLVVQQKDLSAVDNVRLYLLKSLKNRLLDLKKSTDMYGDGIGDNDFRMEVSFFSDIIDREERQQLAARVENLLTRLTPHQREAIYLRYMHEMGYDDIASLLGITPDSVRKQVHRAIEKLRAEGIGIAGLILTLHFSGGQLIS